MKRNRYIYPDYIKRAELLAVAAWSLLALLAGTAIAIVLLEIIGHAPR